MRILITGGAGTVGAAFIRAYSHLHEFAVFSRNEAQQAALKQEFPDVQCYLGNIESLSQLLVAYRKFRPEAVIHAAAVKHIDLAEKNPAQTCRVNVLGSLNVIEAAQLCRIQTTIGISTDKACNASVYGYTKYLMERAFLEANSYDVRFACCRFGNVAKSSGSVIPKWLAMAARKEPLQITDPTMCRLMISQPDAAKLVMRALQEAQFGGGFVMTKKLKQVNILELAKAISRDYVVTGSRAGEKQHEALLMPTEIPYSCVTDEGYIKIGSTLNPDLATRFDAGYDSSCAEQMTPAEIFDLINS
jgi:FlaA1/EpsC-like NDP-sugar epimerase